MSKQFLRTDNQKKRIISVEFFKSQDECPDLSWIGQYQGQPGPSDKTIDRDADGYGRNRVEYRYFVAAHSGEETGNPKSVEEDYRRMEDYGNGWCMIYCCAVATISVKGVIQKISSGGLGGIESDSEDGYFEEIKKEQLSELDEVLRSLGFRQKQIATAFKSVKEQFYD